MTAEECRKAIEDLAPQISRYADLIVRTGV
ncbi:MAG: hypothetical protein Q4G41_00420, partial [Coriobacteriales bacterium]|nr:hypothetical protein [Coriobacteriales bacterium]